MVPGTWGALSKYLFNECISGLMIAVDHPGSTCKNALLILGFKPMRQKRKEARGHGHMAREIKVSRVFNK